MKTKSDRVFFKKIREKIDMEDILAHYGLLKSLRRKGDELVGPCPIHGKNHYKKDSFYVNTAKNKWHCSFWVWDTDGSVLDFVAAMENVDIGKAGLLVQRWFGITDSDTTGQENFRRK